MMMAQFVFLFLTRAIFQETFKKISVFIRISAQPQISAHLEKAPILKVEKVNKRPASNKRPPPPPPKQTQISAHPHPTHLSE